MAISVVIVDDQAMVRQGLGALLAAQRDVSVVGEAADGAQAALFAYQHVPARRPVAGDVRGEP